MYVRVYRAHAREKKLSRTYPTKTKRAPGRGSLRKCGERLVLGVVFVPVLLRQFLEHLFDVVEALPVRRVVLEEPKERDEYVEGYAQRDDSADNIPVHFASLFTLM